MIHISELRKWMNTLDLDSSVGIDEGGLTLHEVDSGGRMTGASYEIGGIPESIERQGPRQYRRKKPKA